MIWRMDRLPGSGWPVRGLFLSLVCSLVLVGYLQAVQARPSPDLKLDAVQAQGSPDLLRRSVEEEQEGTGIAELQDSGEKEASDGPDGEPSPSKFSLKDGDDDAAEDAAPKLKSQGLMSKAAFDASEEASDAKPSTEADLDEDAALGAKPGDKGEKGVGDVTASDVTAGGATGKQEVGEGLDAADSDDDGVEGKKKGAEVAAEASEDAEAGDSVEGNDGASEEDYPPAGKGGLTRKDKLFRLRKKNEEAGDDVSNTNNEAEESSSSRLAVSRKAPAEDAEGGEGNAEDEPPVETRARKTTRSEDVVEEVPADEERMGELRRTRGADEEASVQESLEGGDEDEAPGDTKPERNPVQGEEVDASGEGGEAETQPEKVGETRSADESDSSAAEDADGASKGEVPDEETEGQGAGDKEDLPQTVQAREREDSGNSGVADEMALSKGQDDVGTAEEEEPFASEVNAAPEVNVGAPEQLILEQAALEDEEDYASFMSELFNAGQRITPAMQGLKDKTAKHVVPKMQELAASGHAAFVKTSAHIQSHVAPLFGSSSPVVATLLAVSMLLLPLALIGGLLYQFRFILTLQRLLVLCNLYLCLYCFTLLSSCFIISGEPMRALRQVAEGNFYVLQFLQALAYIVFMGLQVWWLVMVSRAKGKDKEPILIVKAVLQILVATGICLHYYIFVFERAMLDKAPKITAWGYFVYFTLFLLLTIIVRPSEPKVDEMRHDL